MRTLEKFISAMVVAALVASGCSSSADDGPPNESSECETLRLAHEDVLSISGDDFSNATRAWLDGCVELTYSNGEPGPRFSYTDGSGPLFNSPYDGTKVAG